MIIIAGTIDLQDPTKRNEALERAKPLQQATRDDEPGCHAYVFSADPCVEGRIAVYELWEDEATLAAHFKHANYEQMKVVLGAAGILNSTNQMYLISAHEGVYDNNGEPREKFFVGS